jgi:hypothetical protein
MIKKSFLTVSVPCVIAAALVFTGCEGQLADGAAASVQRRSESLYVGAATDGPSLNVVGGGALRGVRTVELQFDTLAEAFDWLTANAEDDTDYTVLQSTDERVLPVLIDSASVNGKSAVSITLTGVGGERTLSHAGPSGYMNEGQLFTITEGVTFILGKDITLQGREENKGGLVEVSKGGIFEMEAGSKITGNRAISGNGAVSVMNAAFTMRGGEISDNRGQAFAAVLLAGKSVFTLEGGTISGNHAGAVELFGKDALFVMNGGEVCDNAENFYGAIEVKGDATFILNGGVISGNKGSWGGGVSVIGAAFTMTGGVIKGNTAKAYGAGVHLGDGDPVLHPGTLLFSKTGGVIYGYTEGDADSNVLKGENGAVLTGFYERGHAVLWFREASPYHVYLNQTVSASHRLDSASIGPESGWTE